MTSSSKSSSPARVGGSFRDPSGYVFSREGRVFRAVDEECHKVIRGLTDDGLLARLTEKGMLVGSQMVEDASLRRDLAAECPGFEHFLEHDVLTSITYPYEWSVSMLADAAVLTLDLQLSLIEHGYSLKDATAYNVQFAGGSPLFIDLGSIERPKRMDVWFALGQFSRMFLFPLLLTRHHGWDLRSYFLGNLDGIDVERVAGSFGRLQRLRPRLLLDVTLPAWLNRWANRPGRARRELLEEPKEDSRPQALNLQRLRKKVRKLADGYKPHGVWSEYADDCHYQDKAQEAKMEAIGEFLRSTRPARVLDIGCNTGQYSRLAVECGAKVTSIDADHDAVELLYRRLRKKPAPIEPLVVDLCNPSPGIGYLNLERPSLLKRVDADCVLALALIHHLLVSGNLSLGQIRDLMFELTQRDLVLEFVPTDDPMFERLMKFRVRLHDDLTLDSCREAFLKRFELLDECPITDSKRTLLLLRKPSQSN